MNKKNLLIIVSILITVVIAVGIYFAFIRKATPQISVTGGNNPFGNSPTDGARSPSNGSSIPSGESFSGVNQIDTNKTIWKIFSAPTSGATFYESGSTTLIRFVEKSTGNIYETNTQTGETKRLTNTTIPKIEEVVWGKNGESFALRFAESGIIETFLGKIVGPNASSTDGFSKIDGKYLAPNITSISFSPKSDQLFYTIPDSLSISGYISDAEGENPSKIWAFGSNEWLSRWPSDNFVTLNTKAGFGFDSYLFLLDTKTGNFERVVKGSALTSLVNPDGEEILYSKNTDNGLETRLYNKKYKIDASIPFSTFSEKCVWGVKEISAIYCGIPKNLPKAEYPDTWYQGRISFNDNLWKYDGETGATEQIADLSKELNEEVDIVEPKINLADNLLIFRNKKDLSLWAVKLPQKTN